MASSIDLLNDYGSMLGSILKLILEDHGYSNDAEIDFRSVVDRFRN